MAESYGFTKEMISGTLMQLLNCYADKDLEGAVTASEHLSLFLARLSRSVSETQMYLSKTVIRGYINSLAKIEGKALSVTLITGKSKVDNAEESLSRYQTEYQRATLYLTDSLYSTLSSLTGLAKGVKFPHGIKAEFVIHNLKYSTAPNSADADNPFINASGFCVEIHLI